MDVQVHNCLSFALINVFVEPFQQGNLNQPKPFAVRSFFLFIMVNQDSG